MKTAQEFLERLRTDEGFAKEVGEKLKEKYNGDEQDYKELWIPVAEECGYAVTGEQLDELKEKAMENVSEEELGKVAGGSTPLCAGALIFSLTGTAVLSISLTHSFEFK